MIARALLASVALACAVAAIPAAAQKAPAGALPFPLAVLAETPEAHAEGLPRAFAFVNCFELGLRFLAACMVAALRDRGDEPGQAQLAETLAPPRHGAFQPNQPTRARAWRR